MPRDSLVWKNALAPQSQPVTGQVRQNRTSSGAKASLPGQLQFVAGQIGVKARIKPRHTNIPDEARPLFSVFAASSKPHRSTSTLTPQISEDDEADQKRLQRNARRRYIQRRTHSKNSDDLIHSGDLATSAENDRLISCFWEAYLPNSRPFPQGTMQITLGDSIFEQLSRESSVLHKGLLALGLTTLGKQSRDPYIVSRGFHIYGDALAQIAKEGKARRKWSEEQLVATRLFSMYEALYGGEYQSEEIRSRSCQLHGSGEAAIIASYPPSTFISGTDHSLFIAGRHHMALFAFVSKKRTFLSDPAWKTIPWTGHTKSPRDHLLDIVVDVPSLFEGVEALKDGKQPSELRESHRRLLCHAVGDISDRLHAWEADHSVAIYPVDEDEDMPATITYPAIAANHLMTLYWSVCVRLVLIQRAILHPYEPSEALFDIDFLCAQILRAARLFLHPDAGLFRQHILPFPLSTVLQHFASVGDNRLVSEREKALAILGSKECEVVRNFITSMEP